MILSKELEALGLSEKEAKVYISLLELVKADVNTIAKKAKINRPTAYVVLNSLLKKGLCSTFEKNKRAFYLAENPENLQMLFNVKKREIEQQEQQLTKVMDGLKAIYELQGDERPFVRFFEGKEGLLATRTEAYEKPGDTIRTMYSLEGFQNFYTDAERKAGHAERNNKNIFAKVLYTSNIEEIPSDSSRDTLKIMSDKYPLAADITLSGDSKVRITSLNEKLSGILIDDPEIYKSFVSLFELAWLGAKSLKDKK